MARLVPTEPHSQTDIRRITVLCMHLSPLRKLAMLCLWRWWCLLPDEAILRGWHDSQALGFQRCREGSHPVCGNTGHVAQADLRVGLKTLP